MAVVCQLAAMQGVFKLLSGSGPGTCAGLPSSAQGQEVDAPGGNTAQRPAFATAMDVPHRHDDITAVGAPFRADACKARC
jgi:hypothetical protein